MRNQTAVEKIYILDGGLARVEDGSIYSPGVNIGIPMTLSCNAYLIRHCDKWILWDTGTPDHLIAEPGGKIVAHGIRGIVVRTIASQFEAIGIHPDDIDYLLLSHAHYDHAGNTKLFKNAKWVVHRSEYNAMFGPEPERFGYVPELYEALRGNERRIVEGDLDLFDDGALRLIATPGHTPGHCSLLLRLPKSGPVLLSGDVAHNRDNLKHHRVPSINADSEASLLSMLRVDELLRTEAAVAWINHDTEQSGMFAHAPAFIV